MSNLDEHPPAGPAETLRLIEEQRAAAIRGLAPHPMAFFGPWGLAWLLGFGVMFLRFGPDGRVFLPMPDWLPVVLLFVLLAAAAVASGVIAGRSYRHVYGRSAVQGAMYGFAWFITFFGMGTTLHMAGGAIWRDRTLFGLGVWTIAINIVGTAIGSGWHSLVISLAGGGAMLVLGLVLWARTRAAT